MYNLFGCNRDYHDPEHWLITLSLFLVSVAILVSVTLTLPGFSNFHRTQLLHCTCTPRYPKAYVSTNFISGWWFYCLCCRINIGSGKISKFEGLASGFSRGQINSSWHRWKARKKFINTGILNIWEQGRTTEMKISWVADCECFARFSIQFWFGY